MTDNHKKNLKFGGVVGICMTIILTGIGGAFTLGQTTQKMDSRVTKLEEKSLYRDKIASDIDRRLGEIIGRFDGKIDTIRDDLSKIKLDIAVIKSTTHK